MQEAFKNFQLETILNIPGHVALANVDVWFQDEARFGQQNTTTRLWARRGSRPELFSNNNSSTSISSVPSALQPGQRKPCSVLW